MKHYIIPALLFALVTSPAVSAPEDSAVMVAYGRANSTCAEFLDADRGTPLGEFKHINRDGGGFWDEKITFFAWAQGFITGRNSACSISKFQKTEIDKPFNAWLRHYCDKNPSHLFYQATTAYLISENAWYPCTAADKQ